VTEQELFSRSYLRTWLEQRQRDALTAVAQVSADEMLARPREQVADEIIALATLVPMQAHEPAQRRGRTARSAG
jgi:hypothetical protein